MASHLSVAAEPRFFPGASIQSRLLGLGLRLTVRPTLDAWSRLPFLLTPPNLLEQAARLLPVPEGTRWRPFDLPGCPAEWVRGRDVDDDLDTGVILYFHGGAFLTCGLNTHRRLVARISASAKRPVLNVGYRQMPHEPITESIADGLAAFRWLLDRGYGPEDITIAGDSAGGYLAFSVARAVVDQGWGRPAGVVAISPLLDLDPTRKGEHRNANRCQTFSMHAVARLTDVADRMDARRGITERRTSPVDMPLADLPPALIQVGSREVLMADAELMANRLTSAGVPCDLQVWDRQVHVFQAAASWVPEARAAIEEVGTFVRHVSEQATPVTPVAPRSNRRPKATATAVQ